MSGVLKVNYPPSKASRIAVVIFSISYAQIALVSCNYTELSGQLCQLIDTVFYIYPYRRTPWIILS